MIEILGQPHEGPPDTAAGRRSHDASGLRRARAARPRYALRWTGVRLPGPRRRALARLVLAGHRMALGRGPYRLTRMRPHDLKHAGVAHLAAAPASTRGRSRGAPVTRIPASPSPLRPPLPRGPPQRRSPSSTLSADDCAQPTVSCGLLPRPRVITDSVPVLTVITEWLGDLVVAVFSQGQARSTGSPSRDGSVVATAVPVRRPTAHRPVDVRTRDVTT